MEGRKRNVLVVLIAAVIAAAVSSLITRVVWGVFRSSSASPPFRVTRVYSVGLTYSPPRAKTE